MALMTKCNVSFLKEALFLLTLVAQVAVAAPAPRSIEPEAVKIKISSTDSAYALVRIIDEDLPTLILLPGIFRGFLPNEDFLQVLNRRKLNWVAWHTSRHPESMMLGNPAPWLTQVTSQNLANELVTLKKTLKIKRPILVTLSYSASIIPYIDASVFPVVIETAPMGRALENNPPSPYYESWKQWMGMFPIFGQYVVANQEYWAYRGYWYQQTMDLAQTHERYAPFLKPISEGLAQLAYAGRQFDLRSQDFAKGPKRFWILGQRENQTRKAIQKQAIRLYEEQTGHQNSMIEIEEAGHIIPNENPTSYVKVLSELVQKLAK